jgi:uncharacterized caspase-like protein
MRKILAFFATVLLLFSGCTIPPVDGGISPKQLTTQPIVEKLGVVKKLGNIDSPQKALVIGNSEYESGKLVNPTNDANDITEILKEMNFYVVKATNLKLDRMNKVIKEFKETLVKYRAGTDVALFYFSGHGAGIDVDGNNYLFPINNNIDAKTAQRGGAIYSDEILKDMKDINRSGVNLMILDACRNEFPPYIDSTKSRFRGGMYPPKSSPNGTAQSYATAFGQTASDNRKEDNSLYTKYLLETLKIAKNQPIDFEEVLMRTRELVSNENSNQIPEYIYKVTGQVCLGFKEC